MNKLIKITLLLLVGLFLYPLSVSAHRSGCHRWHSCPSDSGSYTCGDTGYCSGCGNNYYCKNSVYSPGWQSKQSTTPIPKPDIIPKPVTTFVGKPQTYTQLYKCNVVGNYSSMIYHLKGSKYIKNMNLKKKECFASEQGAIDKGFRKAKTK